MSDLVKNLILFVVIVVVLVSVFSNFSQQPANTNNLSYSQFLRDVQQGNVGEVTIQDRTIKGVMRNNQPFSTYMPISDQFLLTELLKKDVNVKGRPPEQQSVLMQIFISWFPMLLLIGIWVFFLRQVQGGGGKGALSFGRSRARLMGEDQVKVTFADVAGVDEAKEEVKELVDFLRAPERFQKLGGQIPRGILLVGPPGTGKTLLAKAVAGEAKVPFFTISGSDFVEMFVGVGASRVRDLFERAKSHAPCIIFIDEIDAVGRKRGAGLGGGHDEREQTLNQLLVEMDGFEGKEGVIVMAATNRPDVLDPALLRPGRFDRQVYVPLPDIRGREQILVVHAKKVPLSKDVNLAVIARGTPGFSGADEENLVNEAALIAGRAGKSFVEMEDFEKAKDKLLMGPERKSMVMSEKERTLTAYHESGHTIVGRLMSEHDPVYKVTIIPRGRALGVTMFLPEEDRYSYTRLRLESELCSLFGGRLAEAIIFGLEHITTGASNDIERATKIARNMVTRWGFSEKLGPQTYSEDEGEVFLGQTIAQRREISDATAQLIDQEVRHIIDNTYRRAEKILQDNIDKLHVMAKALVKYETLESEQIDDIMAGKEPRPPEGWDEIERMSRAVVRDAQDDQSKGDQKHIEEK